MNTLVVLNSNTQQQHTDYKPWERCLPEVLQIQIYILRFIDTSICIQVTYKQQQSELHLHLDTSVFSIMCDDQDLQVPKLLHTGHPNLLCYNVWEERTFQLFSHHYMKAEKDVTAIQKRPNIRGLFRKFFCFGFWVGFFWGFVCGLALFFFFYINVHCIFQTVHCMYQSSKPG